MRMPSSLSFADFASTNVGVPLICKAAASLAACPTPGRGILPPSAAKAAATLAGETQLCSRIASRRPPQSLRSVLEKNLYGRGLRDPVSPDLRSRPLLCTAALRSSL
jgi:hypothetical protein